MLPGFSIVVFEKHRRSAMGATALAAGGVRAQFSTQVNIELSLRSIEFFERFEIETGVDPQFRQNGYLLLACSGEGKRHLETAGELQRSLGADVSNPHIEDLIRLYPFIDVADVAFASFSPDDGYLDPYTVCKGFEQAAKVRGVTARYGEEVTRGGSKWIEVGNEKVACGIVLLCPGHWAGPLAERFEISLPIRHKRHMLALTERVDIPKNSPMIVDIDTSFHFRPEGERILVGYDWNCDTLADPDQGAKFDYGFLEGIAEIGLKRLPLLETAAFDTNKCWAGYYAETPDHHAIIGETNSIFIAAGFGGHGIMHSPAAGRAISCLIAGKEPQVTIHALRPSRFQDSPSIEESFII
jgi:sarcosine oxidase subunit beta